MIIYNPFDGSEAGQVRNQNEKEVSKEIDSAGTNENKLSKDERLDCLNSLFNKIFHEKESIARRISTESGLCLQDTLYEVDRSLEVIQQTRIYLEELNEETFHFSKSAKPKLMTHLVPLNLVAAITPFNHPLNQVAHKLVPAIAANANIILKPSEKTPITALSFLEHIYDVGFPENQFKIVTSSNPKMVLNRMVNYPQIELLTFTGGIQTGKKIDYAISQSDNPFIKRVFELGGNNAFFVSKNANFQLAIKIGLTAFKNSGQRCTAIRRIIVDSSIFTEFKSKFTENVEKIKIGNPLSSSTNMGTVIDENSAKEIQRKVNQAILDGAKLICGNKRDGALFSPTVLEKVSEGSELARIETFGPVVILYKVDSLKSAIKMVNSIKYRLAGAIATESKSEAWEYYKSIDVGQFNWNAAPGYRFEQAPFGGFGWSGNYTKEGVISCTNNYMKIRTFYEH